MAGFLAGLARDFAGGKILSIADNALGRPFELWSAQVTAENAAQVRQPSYLGNLARPNVFPTPDAVFAAYRRGLLSHNVAAWALMSQGIAPSPDHMRAVTLPWLQQMYRDTPLGQRNRDLFGFMWQNVAYMNMSRPDAGTIAAMQAQGRITSAAAADLKHGLDASWHRYDYVASGAYQSPGFDDLRSMWSMGRISGAEYQLWARRAGWTNAEARGLSERISTLPTVAETLLAHWRGGLTDAQLRQRGMGLGYVNDDDWRAVTLASRQLPGPSDLVRFAVREVWDEDIVRRWGYDEEFPAPFKAWMGWWGQDWGERLRLPGGAQIPHVPWPLAHWRAHWQIISPEQAYRAYHLLRPERIGRYQQIAPGVRAFTADDLRSVLKVSDYPQPMRQWLAAIAYTPLDLRTVRQLYLLGVRDRDWTIAQMQDRGLVREDAQAWVELTDRQRAERDRAPIVALERSLVRATYRETLAGYRDGLLSREDSRNNMLAIGMAPASADRAMLLADAQFEHDRARELIRAVRKQFLAGQLSETELPGYFQAMGLLPAAAARYVLRWRQARSLERRALSSAQVTGLLAAGAITIGTARARLANLGWFGADAELLLGQSLAKLATHQSREAARVARLAKATQRERLTALARAERAAAQLRSSLRRTTPLSAIRRWYSLGIRKGSWVRSRMLAMGYDTSSIDGYLSQWTLEDERTPHTEAPAVEGREKLAKRQTSLGTVKRWWQNGVVTDAWAVRRLATLGYGPESIALYRREWEATLGRKPGPAPEPIAPEPAIAPEGPRGPRQLHTEPRQLHTEPRDASAPP